MSAIDYPKSIDLARLPTPIEDLRRLSRRVGARVLAKRDDLTGAALTGNKIRKLEFLLAEALEQGFGGVVTCGGQQSNHARATAVAAARLGLRCHLLLRTTSPDSPPEPSGNILLDRVVGASIEWITPEQYQQRDELMTAAAERLGTEHATRFYVVPEGGSNALGAWGYVRCAEELCDQLGRVPVTIVCAVGSGGTAAGLIAGCRLLGLPYRVVGVCVADDRSTFQARIAAILDEMADRYQLDVRTEPQSIELWEDYVGLGYGVSRDEELACIADVARLEGLILDPVYTGKAMVGLLTELERMRTADPVVFLHTGGIFGLAAVASRLAGTAG